MPSFRPRKRLIPEERDIRPLRGSSVPCRDFLRAIVGQGVLLRKSLVSFGSFLPACAVDLASFAPGDLCYRSTRVFRPVDPTSSIQSRSLEPDGSNTPKGTLHVIKKNPRTSSPRIFHRRHGRPQGIDPEPQPRGGCSLWPDCQRALDTAY